ncbi:MAG: hypothetical protein V7L11_21705 [Nostoc sp.]|uniref:hypothetical protein n=1 Tax=Nostoc sp. TaxID=1180 RepID=UPI002FF6924D
MGIGDWGLGNKLQRKDYSLSPIVSPLIPILNPQYLLPNTQSLVIKIASKNSMADT